MKNAEFFRSWVMTDILTDFPFLIFTAKKTIRFIFTARRKAIKSMPSKIMKRQVSEFMIQATEKKTTGRLISTV